MLKSILQIFGFVSDATPDQSEKSRKHLVSALSRRLENLEGYTVIFAYGMRPGFIETKITCYAVAFSIGDVKLAVVPIYYDSDEIEDLILLHKRHIKSITIGLQGEKIIKSDMLEGDLRFTVPYFTKENADEFCQLPILQMNEAAAFEKWIKDNF